MKKKERQHKEHPLPVVVPRKDGEPEVFVSMVRWLDDTIALFWDDPQGREFVIDRVAFRKCNAALDDGVSVRVTATKQGRRWLARVETI